MKSHFIHLVVAFVIAIVALFGYKFWYAAIADKSTTVADLQNRIETNTEARSRITSARATLAEVANNETTMQSYFVPETSVVTFIDGLEAQGKAQEANINVLSVSKGVVSAQPAFTLALTITGTFDAVMRTIGVIEYSPYDLSIPTLSLGQDDRNSWHANLSLLVGSVTAATSTATSTP